MVSKTWPGRWLIGILDQVAQENANSTHILFTAPATSKFVPYLLFGLWVIKRIFSYGAMLNCSMHIYNRSIGPELNIL